MEIRKDFDTKLQAELYLIGLKLDMEKGYLTRSEREELKQYLDKPELLIAKKEVIRPAGLPVIMDRTILNQPSGKVIAGDDIKGIIQSLKDTISSRNDALGLSAPQIGIKKCISYIKVPTLDSENKTISYKETVLINPVITEKSKLVHLRGEGCVSFPGLKVDTDRYIFCTIEYQDENFKKHMGLVQDLEAFVIQHEVDHLNGILLFDRKHKAR